MYYNDWRIHMRYDLDSLTKIANDAQLNIPLDLIGPRTSKALVRAFKVGYLPSISGEGALYHAVLSDQVKIPIMQFSKRGSYWDSLHFKNFDTRYIPQLSEWWQVDRVAYRLSNPEGWEEASKSKTSWKYGEFCQEPDWKKQIEAGRHSWNVRILSGKDTSMFEGISKALIATDEYKEKSGLAIKMIESGETIRLTYEFRPK